MKNCPNCQKEITKIENKFCSKSCASTYNNLQRDNSIDKKPNNKLIQEEWLNIETGKYKCPYCQNEYKKNGIGTHIWRMHGDGKDFTANNVKHKNGTAKLWNKGLTKETSTKIAKLAQKQSDKMLKELPIHFKKWNEYQKSDIGRKKQSERMKQVVEDNQDSYSSNNVCGRVKVYEFDNNKFHGTWELEFAKYLVNNNIKYERDIHYFNYEWDGANHKYFPDFYIPSIDMYVEVKGYERPRDIAKWSVVKNLIVLKEKEINEMKKGVFKL